MTSQIQEDKNLEDGPLSLIDRSTPELSQVRKSKKKKKLALFSFRSKRSQNTANSSKDSTFASESAYRVESTWTEASAETSKKTEVTLSTHVVNESNQTINTSAYDRQDHANAINVLASRGDGGENDSEKVETESQSSTEKTYADEKQEQASSAAVAEIKGEMVMDGEGEGERQNSTKHGSFILGPQHTISDRLSGSTEYLPYSSVRKSKTKKWKMPNANATHLLTVRLLSGEDLVARDTNGKSDPYVKFKIGNRTVYKSRIRKATLNPEWMEDFSVPASLEDELVLRVFDYDIGIRDDFMGSNKIELSDLAEGEQASISLPLEDENAVEAYLGSVHLEITMEPFIDEPDASTYVDTEQIPDEYSDTISVASSRLSTYRTHLSKTDRSASQQSASATPEIKNRKSVKASIATVTVQLVSGTGLPARDSNGLSDPYVKINLGKQRHRSKVCYKTLHPVWKEEFVFHLTGQELFEHGSSTLDITVWDKDSYRKDDFIGRCELDLSPLDNDNTHPLTLNLTDAPGSLLLLVTKHSSIPSDTPMNNTQLSNLHGKFTLMSTFSEISDIGFVEVKIIKATGCRAADIGGKSDPFCVVELCNQRAQTHTCYKTLDPVWNKTVTFPIKDIHDVLKFTVYDEDKDGEADFLGKVSVPLLRVRSGEERSYILKDRKLLNKSKGSISLQISLIYNPVRAAIRTFSPREQIYMEQEAKFKKQLLIRNFRRVWANVQATLQVLEFVNSCFTWQNPVRSATAFVVYMMIVWNVELYMLPILLLLLLLKNYFAVIVQKNKADRTVKSSDDEFSDDDDDDEDDGEGSTNRMSLIARLNAIQEVLLKVQGILDWIACLLERIHNTFTWSVPFLSALALIVLFGVTLLLHFISFRTIAILWGINKFTKRIRKPNYVPNNELLDFLSRIPSEVELDEYQEISPLHGSPKSLKKKK